MKKLLLILPLVVLAGVSWWMLGEPPALEQAVQADKLEVAGEAKAPALIDAEPESDPENAEESMRAEFADGDPSVAENADATPPGVAVLVLDADSKRLAGATVRWKLDAAAGSLAADGDGGALLPLTPPLVRAELSAELEGYAIARTSASGGGPFTLRLFALTSLSGRVLEAGTRAPLEGVELTVSHGKCNRCERDVTVSGPDGTYEFSEIPLGTDLSIFAQGPDVAGQHSALRLHSDGAPHLHDFLLERGHFVRGQVFDLVSRSPIEGARVAAFKSEASSVRTDASGRFELRVVPVVTSYKPGEPPAVVLKVELEEYAVLEADLTRSGTDLSGLVELPLLRTAAIEGVVRDPEGQPVPQARVALSTRGDEAALRSLGYYEKQPSSSASRPTDSNERVPRSPLDELPEGWRWIPPKLLPALCDDHGRYALTGRLPWQPGVGLLASGDGFEHTRVDLPRFPGPGEIAQQDLVLARSSGGTVFGDLTLNGRAVNGRVEWHQGGVSGSAMVVNSPYRIDGLQPGPVELEAHPFGFHVSSPAVPGLARNVLTVDVPAEGELRADFDVRVDLAPIQGVTVDDLGDPLAGVYVLALLDGMLMAKSTPTDESGSFSIDVPAEAGPYTLSASRQNDSAVVEGIAAGDRDLRFVLVRSGQLLFRVRDARTGAALAALVHWRREETEMLRRAWKPSSPDPEGWQRLDLPAGVIDVRLADVAGEFVPLRATVRLAPGLPTRLDADLERGLVATLEFDPPLPDDLEVYLVPDGGMPREFDALLTIPAGARAELSGLAPGTYHLAAWADEVPLDVVWIPAVFELSTESNEHTVRWTRRR